MKEKPVSSKYAKTPRREATGEGGRQLESEPRQDTSRRIRKIAERHKETLDYLAER
jgi:hypothetical protein